MATNQINSPFGQQGNPFQAMLDGNAAGKNPFDVRKDIINAGNPSLGSPTIQQQLDQVNTEQAYVVGWRADDKRLRNLGFNGIMDQSMYNTWLDTAGNASLLSEAEANGGMTPTLYNSLITANKDKKKSNKLGIKLLKAGLGLAGGALAGGFGTLGGNINPAFAGSAQLPSSFINTAGSFGLSGAQAGIDSFSGPSNLQSSSQTASALRAPIVAQQPQLAEQGQNAFTRNSSANGKQLFRI